MDTSKFVWLCGAFSTFWISLFLLCFFWKMEVIRLAGLYAIIPLVTLFGTSDLQLRMSFKMDMLILASLESFLILLVVYLFRHLYKLRFVIPWMLLAFEVFRWTWLIVFYVLGSHSVLSYFEAELFYFYYFVPFIVLLYSVVARKKSNIVQQAPD